MLKKGELIGEGAFGKVYKALNPLKGNFLALKIITMNKMNDSEK